ncbi:MAG: mucoidy inhibitor MuiA family protein [Planctomycetota bacterium]
MFRLHGTEASTILLAVGLLLLLGVTTTTLAAEESIVGEVCQVRLYRGQAMVTREIPVNAMVERKLVVKDLPEHIVSDSLFAESSPGVEVRAIRYRTHAVGEAARQEIRELDAQIEEVEHKIARNDKNKELLSKQLAYLDQLEGFVAPTAKNELSQGVLDAEALKAVTLFSFEQRQELLNKQVENDQEAEDLSEQQSLLQRKRSELTDNASRTAREAVIFAEKKDEQPAVIRLSYLVDSCGWSPSYTIRAGEDREHAQIECSAMIHQMTGEHWSDVELTLSTASPALSATGPGLAPFPVTLVPADQQQPQAPADLTQKAQSIRSRQQEAITNLQNTLNSSENIGLNWDANAAANEFQRLELSNPKTALRSIEMEMGDSQEGPSLAYHIETPVSLASRSDQQMVRIFETSLPSAFRHVATPILTSYVYREAEITNESEQDMLGGPMTVYLNGSFVGRGEIPTVARGQTFVAGFGVDPQLRAKRELADKDSQIQGGNRRLTFSYRLLIENYKTEPVELSVFDRLPHTERPADINIQLADLEDPLSNNKLYQRVERPKGILRWDITVPASATGEKARQINYTYTTEFDRKFEFSAPESNQPAQQREFEELQRARSKR